MQNIVRTTLSIYLSEKRIPVLSDFSTDISAYTTTRDSVFVTLYVGGRVIASSGRISCTKPSTFFECIDNTLLCLSDKRFTAEMQNISKLADISIRVDTFTPADRHILSDISQYDMSSEGLMILSQNLGKLAILLPHITTTVSTPAEYMDLVCTKAGLDAASLTRDDYILYGVSTRVYSDME